MIEIKNLRNTRPSQPWDVRVDRQSVLGNPFHMHSESERDKVCDAYKACFVSSMQDPNFRKEFWRIYRIYMKYGKLNLFCWCAPKRCHAETIRKYLELAVVKNKK